MFDLTTYVKKWRIRQLKTVFSTLDTLCLGAVGDRHHGLADQVDLVDLAQFLDNDFVSQFHMGGTQEYIKWVHGPLARITVFGTFRQLRS